MTLKQLRYFCEIVRRGMHLSHAASSLYTSQPGVSRQIQLLERELGVPLFNRGPNRILGLTPMGERLYRYAERAVQEADNFRRCGEEIRDEAAGKLVIGTVHTLARYTLPPVIQKFMRRFPKVRLHFWQGSRDEVYRWTDTGEVDLAIGTDCESHFENVVLVPFGEFHRIAVTPPRHALLRIKRPSLEELAAHPIITYGPRADGRWKLARLFESKRIPLNIVFSALDCDVAKAYVALGLGIAIIPHIAFDAHEDSRLRAVDLGNLFGAEIMHIGLNRHHFYGRYAIEFMEMLAPGIVTRRKVERLLVEDS